MLTAFDGQYFGKIIVIVVLKGIIIDGTIVTSRLDNTSVVEGFVFKEHISIPWLIGIPEAP